MEPEDRITAQNALRPTDESQRAGARARGAHVGIQLSGVDEIAKPPALDHEAAGTGEVYPFDVRVLLELLAKRLGNARPEGTNHLDCVMRAIVADDIVAEVRRQIRRGGECVSCPQADEQHDDHRQPPPASLRPGIPNGPWANEPAADARPLPSHCQCASVNPGAHYPSCPPGYQAMPLAKPGERLMTPVSPGIDTRRPLVASNSITCRGAMEKWTLSPGLSDTMPGTRAISEPPSQAIVTKVDAPTGCTRCTVAGAPALPRTTCSGRAPNSQGPDVPSSASASSGSTGTAAAPTRKTGLPSSMAISPGRKSIGGLPMKRAT